MAWNKITGQEWSKDEEDLLKENYQNLSKAELAKLLPNRTIDSIHRKAWHLNLSKSFNYWSSDEDEILHKYYRIIPNKELLELLPRRTSGAIKARAELLNIKRKRKNIAQDYTGATIGKFKVVSFSHKDNKRRYWNIECLHCEKNGCQG